MNNDSAQVAVFIDYDNIEISVTDTLGKDAEVEWDKVLETASRIGRTVLRRAYADWSEQRSIQRDLLGLGIDLVHVSSKRGKNAADIRIVIDALEMLYNPNSRITHVLLVSGDGDFTELVHHLRERNKVVIGIGISGTSAEYLVNACDEFIFYDKLVAPPPAPVKPNKVSPNESPAPSFDITEARLLLRRVLEASEGEWTLAANLKQAMLRLNPSFNERNYNFSSFKDFLQAQQELLINIRTFNNQLEVQLIPEAPPLPETILENYLQILAGQKIRMTPNEYRPAIIFKFYEFGKAGGLSLTQLKDRVHAHFEENAPHVTVTYITETAHQLFHTFCFTFEKETNGQASDVKLWDRRAAFAPEINRATELLDRCDKGILQKIARVVGSPEKIDKQVAARLLYGSFRGQRMLDHVSQLISELK